jgi:hypothetical protein
VVIAILLTNCQIDQLKVIMFQFRAVTLGRAPRFTHRYLGIYFPQNNFISRRGVVSATMAGGTQSVSGVIKHDHRELETITTAS